MENREIKLKVWDAENKVFFDTGDTDVYWNCTEGVLTAHFVDKNGDWSQLEIIRYTGLKDKNGIPIYEGDIVKCIHTEGISWEKTYVDIGYVVYTDRSSFAVKCIKRGSENAKDASKRYFFLSFHPEKEFEVIGNVYQNPELINL